MKKIIQLIVLIGMALPIHSATHLKQAFIMIGKTMTQAVIYSAVGYFAIQKGVDYLIEKNKEPDFKVYQPGEIKESFASIAGYDREKQLFKDIVNYLKNPTIYESVGAKPSKGILLTGAAGTGKTMLGRALAGEANCSFIYACGADFGNAARIKKIFEQAKAESKPCIIFLDEFELLALNREKEGHSSTLVIELLTELDGFIKDQNYPIIVIAATNFPDKLDPAVLRPGRINRKIQIQNPKVADRKAILQVHLNKIKHEQDLDLSSIAQRTESFTGAQLAEIIQSAARIAANNNRSCVTIHDIEEAFDTEALGVISSRKPSLHQQKITAYHEAGHALICLLTQPKFKVTKITIVGRESAGGLTTMIQNDEEEILSSKDDHLSMIAIGFGGRAAEEIIFNLISSGPENDLEKTTNIAKTMIQKYGMGNSLMVETGTGKINGKALDSEINALLNAQYQRTVTLLRENIDLLHKLAQALLEKETLYSDEIYALVGNKVKRV